ncbi:hypothetical protein SRHO_G00245070 [Serrasalmus rhombeus]
MWAREQRRYASAKIACLWGFGFRREHIAQELRPECNFLGGKQQPRLLYLINLYEIVALQSPIEAGEKRACRNRDVLIP